jgi:hypothetical protein
LLRRMHESVRSSTTSYLWRPSATRNPDSGVTPRRPCVGIESTYTPAEQLANSCIVL